MEQRQYTGDYHLTAVLLTAINNLIVINNQKWLNVGV